MRRVSSGYSHALCAASLSTFVGTGAEFCSFEEVDLADARSRVLVRFRSEMQSRGLSAVYTDLNDLAFKIRNAIEDGVSEMELGAPSVVRKAKTQYWCSNRS